jgi:hypothetical protein
MSSSRIITPEYRVEDRWGEQEVVHNSNLGDKVEGQYPDKKWSEVARDGVSLDDTIHWDNEIEYLNYKREQLSNTGGEKIIVNEKKMDSSIRESGGSSRFSEKGTGESKNQNALGKSDQDSLYRKWAVKNYKGSHSDKETGKNKNYYRKKKIPTSRIKKYPVKPIRDQDLEKKQANQEKFEDVAYSKEFEEKDAIESVQNDLNEEYWDTHSMEDYPGADDFIKGEDSEEVSPRSDPKIYDEFGNRKGHLGFIYFKEKPHKSIVTFYEEETDSYDYSFADIWAGSSMPVYLGDVMWSSPKEWTRPEIDWVKIWTEMDYKRCGIRRSFEFYPPTTSNQAEIRFHSSSL